MVRMSKRLDCIFCLYMNVLSRRGRERLWHNVKHHTNLLIFKMLLVLILCSYIISFEIIIKYIRKQMIAQILKEWLFLHILQNKWNPSIDVSLNYEMIKSITKITKECQLRWPISVYIKNCSSTNRTLNT